MHNQHDMFTQAIKNNKKIIMSYFSGVENLYLTGLFVPLKYNPPAPEGGTDSYCFWDSEADLGERLLTLSSFLIEHMETSEESFNPNDYIVPEE